MELLTTSFRISFHLQSARAWHKLHWPHIHHAYPGIAFLISFYYLGNPWLWVIGGALIISDLSHHWLVCPALSAMQYEVCMTKHEKAHRLLQRVTGLVLLLTGVVGVAIPFVPTTPLAIAGLFLIGGRSLVRRLCLTLMSPRTYAKLKIGPTLDRLHVL